MTSRTLRVTSPSQTAEWREKKKNIPLEFHRRSVAENPQFPITANAHMHFLIPLIYQTLTKPFPCGEYMDTLWPILATG